MKLPEPIKLNGSTRWCLSQLEVIEAHARGVSNPEPLPSEQERYLSVKQLAERYGVSVPTIWRWTQKEAA